MSAIEERVAEVYTALHYELAEAQIVDSPEGFGRRVAFVLSRNGLLSRELPSRDEIYSAIVGSFLEFYGEDKTDWRDRATDAVLALLRGEDRG